MTTNSLDPKPSSPTPNGFSALIVVLIVAVLLVIAGAIYMATSHHAPAKAVSTPSPSPSASPSSSPQTSPSSSPVATNITACASQNLAGSIDSTGGGTAGTLWQKVVLTNKGTVTCTLTGFPGVSLVSQASSQLGQPAQRDGSSGQTVTLAPGHAADAPVGFPDTSNFQAGTCSAKSTGLLVYPPGQTAPLTISLVAQYCPGFEVETLVPYN
jgi:hypothetical protein